MAPQTFNLQPEKLEDDLVLIVPLTDGDFNRLYKVASDPLIWEGHPSKDRYKKEVFKQFFDSAVISNSAFLVFDKQTNELIGSTRFYDFKPEKSKVAIGFTFLAKAYWGGVHNKSMKKLLLNYAFKFVDTVNFHIGPTNIRSQKAILKIGAKKVNDMELEYSETMPDHFQYEIKKCDLID